MVQRDGHTTVFLHSLLLTCHSWLVIDVIVCHTLAPRLASTSSRIFMNQWPAFDISATLGTLASLVIAFSLGALIGFERQIRQRTAGLRTNTLVAVGAAVFVDLAVRFHDLYGGSPSPMQVIAYVVSGIGFLGAGAIMKEGANVSGLNTAATLWGSAAVGCCAGAKLLPEAILAALFVLAANTLLRPVVNRINRQPIQEELSEATYAVYVICRHTHQPEIREKLLQWLDQASYPVRDIEQHAFGQGDTEIEATLYATAVEGDELDKIMARLEAEDGVLQAFWNARAED